MRAEEIVARARSVVGAPFRPQGREPTEGLDCVGVAACALGLGRDAVPRDYRLRGGDAGLIARQLSRAGLAPISRCDAAPGDIALFVAGVGQLHLAVLTGSGLVHADAGLRKVVERPGPPPWPLAGLWRAQDEYYDGRG